MSDVKRYNPVAEYIGTGDYIGGTEEADDGDYVYYRDYDALRAELAAARKDAAECRALLKRVNDSEFELDGVLVLEIAAAMKEPTLCQLQGLYTAKR